MHSTVTMADNDVVSAIEVSPDMTVADSRAYALEEAGEKPSSASISFFNNRPLKDSSTLEAAGSHDHDIVLLGSPDHISQQLGAGSRTASFPSRTTTFPASQVATSMTANGSPAFAEQAGSSRNSKLGNGHSANNASNGANNGTTSPNSGATNGASHADGRPPEIEGKSDQTNGSMFNGSNPNDPYEDPSFGAQIEAARRQILYDPQSLVQLAQQSPELADASHDPEQFKHAYLVLQQQQSRNKAENDEIDRNFRSAMEEMPEAFTTVTMSFANIEVNGIPVKAFIDSGAQTTIMSPECAERCNSSHLIDKRHRGMAYGVGQATILGRIHMAPIKIGASFFACSMTVIEGTNMEFLLGLDMLKHHQATIDSRRNRSLMGHEESPFSSESEIPKNSMGPPGSAGPALVSKPGTGSPRGASNNLGVVTTGVNGAGPSEAGSSDGADAENDLSESEQPEEQLDNHRRAPASSAAKFDESAVNTLMNLGFGRPQVSQASQRAGGNADIAAAMSFGE